MYCIPTTFAGVNFRSRLEAKWAAMFTIMGWPWTYEPFDLSGYIPDFVLSFKRPILVEVKGTASIDDLHDCTDKIDKSGWVEDSMMVCSIFDEDAIPNDIFPDVTFCRIGIFRDSLFNSDLIRDGFHWSDCVVGICTNCGRVAPFCADSPEQCRVCGNGYSMSFSPADSSMVVGSWREAGNTVQWNRR